MMVNAGDHDEPTDKKFRRTLLRAGSFRDLNLFMVKTKFSNPNQLVLAFTNGSFSAVLSSRIGNTALFLHACGASAFQSTFMRISGLSIQVSI